MDWDDLRFVIAVAREGSALAASQRLGVNASTVQRRIARFETDNSVRLFERRRRGLFPTQQCLELVDRSKLIEDTVAEINRAVLGRDQRLEGLLKVTTTETFLTGIVARQIAGFHKLHPAIKIEVTLTNATLNLSREDADVAIRPSMNPQETLVGQRVSKLAFAAYAKPDLAHGLPDKPDLAQLSALPWVMQGASLAAAPPAQWLKANIPPSSVVMTLDTYPSLAICVEEGLGFAILPCVLGDRLEGAKRFELPGDIAATHVWVLTHPEIRNVARIKAFTAYISKALRDERPAFEGTTH